MTSTEQSKPSPTAPDKRASLVPLLLILSATTGLVDAVSVLGLGKVFVANMTGNVVLLGFALAGVPGYLWMPYVVAIVFFTIGAAIGGRVGNRYSDGSLRGWLVSVAVAETLLLWISAWFAKGYDIAALEPRSSLYLIIAFTAIAMGMRNSTVRLLKVPDLTATVLTMTLTGLAADSTAGGGVNPNWRRRVGAVVAMLLGALVGGLLVMASGLSAPLLLAGAITIVATLWLARG
jgi:uncharacterized membrane protein YoaK (UPF0700 family)